MVIISKLSIIKSTLAILLCLSILIILGLGINYANGYLISSDRGLRIALALAVYICAFVAFTIRLAFILWSIFTNDCAGLYLEEKFLVYLNKSLFKEEVSKIKTVTIYEKSKKLYYNNNIEINTLGGRLQFVPLFLLREDKITLIKKFKEETGIIVDIK